MRRAAWGLGYATEGSQALIFKGFTEPGTQRVTSTALVVNQAAVRVMEKAGLKFEKTFIYEPMNQEAVKYAVVVVANLPILLLYPFLQKYFVKGVMIGAIKG